MKVTPMQTRTKKYEPTVLERNNREIDVRANVDVQWIYELTFIFRL